jgi:hypothetical protein
MTKKFFLLMLGCVAASGALAQQMYKSVGPDGKVTFSDRPAYEKAKKLSVMRSYILRPVEEFKPMPDPSATPAKTGPVINPNATVTPEVEDVMVNVMGLTEFGRKYLPLCSFTPAGAKAFSNATSQWRKRNVDYIEHQKRLLMEVVSPNKRAELQERAAVYVEDLGKSVPQTVAERKEWCAGTIAEFESGHSDLNKPVMLAVPITKYKAK